MACSIGIGCWTRIWVGPSPESAIPSRLDSRHEILTSRGWVQHDLGLFLERIPGRTDKHLPSADKLFEDGPAYCPVSRDSGSGSWVASRTSPRWSQWSMAVVVGWEDGLLHLLGWQWQSPHHAPSSRKAPPDQHRRRPILFSLQPGARHQSPDPDPWSNSSAA